MLVPLTSSVYAEGTVCEPGRVMVDIGTGYYMKVSLGSRSEFMLNMMLDARKDCGQDELLSNLQVTASIQRSHFMWLLENQNFGFWLTQSSRVSKPCRTHCWSKSLLTGRSLYLCSFSAHLTSSCGLNLSIAICEGAAVAALLPWSTLSSDICLEYYLYSIQHSHLDMEAW